MNNENTVKIKKVLEEAAGGTAGQSVGWKSEGVERLFLDEFGAEGFRGGCVEVRHSEDARNAESVRVELELAPPLAARVIALVTNTTLGEMPDLTGAEQAAIEECVVAPEIHGQEEVLPAFCEQDRRNKEIAELILAQRKERELEKEAALENKPSPDDPDELNFDLPADKDT